MMLDWLADRHGDQALADGARAIEAALAKAFESGAVRPREFGGMSGTADIVRAVALGADAVLMGKCFLWSIGALGERGPEHAMDLLLGEARASLGQVGALTLSEARAAEVRHPGAYAFE